MRLGYLRGRTSIGIRYGRSINLALQLNSLRWCCNRRRCLTYIHLQLNYCCSHKVWTAATPVFRLKIHMKSDNVATDVCKSFNHRVHIRSHPFHADVLFGWPFSWWVSVSMSIRLWSDTSYTCSVRLSKNGIRCSPNFSSRVSAKRAEFYLYVSNEHYNLSYIHRRI